MTDRHTDGQTDAWEKNNMSPDPEGGRHNFQKDGVFISLILAVKVIYI